MKRPREATIQDPRRDEMSNESEGSHRYPGQVNGFATIAPPGGVFVPLKTTLETTTIEKVISVYITAVPTKQASGTLT